MSRSSHRLRTWPYAAAGALLLFGLVVAGYAGDEEASDPLIVLGSFAVLLGALLGALAGEMINGKRRKR
jgi:drug/metabolite transporter (DMT)-like permease